MEQESTFSRRNIGIGIAIGLAIGAVFAVATGSFVFLIIGLPLGIPIGLAMSQDQEVSAESRRIMIGTLVLGVVLLATLTATYFYFR